MNLRRDLFVLLILPLLPSLGCSTTRGQESSGSFIEIQEVVSRWSAGQLLWISGEVPVSGANLLQLRQWLGEEAPHWTVVIMASAAGQRYEGLTGMDAVELALGEGLPNQTGFGQLVHPRTGEADGAILVIFLEERKISYHASAAYGKRGLGREQWVGNLDQDAIRAMRNGGRVTEAVKDTITTITNRLERALASEEAVRGRRESQAREAPEWVGKKAADAAERAASLRERDVLFRGALAFPDEANWTASLESMKNQLAEGNWEEIFKLSGATEAAIDRYNQSLDQWERDAAAVAALRARIGAPPGVLDVPVAKGLLSRARLAAESAARNHRAGDPLYRDQMREAETALAEADRETAAARDRQMAKAAEEKARKIRNGVAGGGLGAVFLGWLAAAKRRRGKVRDEAVSLRQEWKKQLRGKFDRLFHLMDRAAVMQRATAGHEGQSKALTVEAVRGVDELFIMSSAADRALDEADRLMAPGHPLISVWNFFFSGNYRKAVALMDSKSILFGEEKSLGDILNRGGKDKRDLIGDEEDYQSFSFTFRQLIETYDRREAAVIRNLEKLEGALDGLSMGLERGRQAIDLLAAQASQLGAAAQRDRLFGLPALGATLIPGALAKLREAAAEGEKDPVTAAEGTLAAALREIEEAAGLAALAGQIRGEWVPAMDAAAEKLNSLGIATDWIANELKDQSNAAEELCAMIPEQSVAAQIGALREASTAVRGRVADALAFAQRLIQQTPADLEELARDIAAAREDLGSVLNLPGQEMLREAGQDPSAHIERSREIVSMIAGALSRGNTEAAVHGFDEIKRNLAEARALIAESQSIAARAADELEQRDREIGTLQGQMPGAEPLLAEMKSRYSPGVLLTGEGSNESLANSLDVAAESLSRARECLALARRYRGEGKMLALGRELEKCQSEIEVCASHLGRVKTHHAELKKQDEENAKHFEALRLRLLALRPKMDNPKTTETSRERQLAADREAGQIARDQEAALPHPFETGRALEGFETAVRELEEKVKRDWAWHETALREVNAASRMLDSVDELAARARNDGITDSKKLSLALREHTLLQKEALNWQVYLSAAHRDWEKAYHGAVAIESEAARIKGVMESELQAANQAVAALQAAAQAIADLKNWSSPFPIRFDPDAGYARYEGARVALEQGNYSETASLAAACRQDAASELGRARQQASQARSEFQAERLRRTGQGRTTGGAGMGAIGAMGGGGRFPSSPGSIRQSPMGRSSAPRSSGFSRSGW